MFTAAALRREKTGIHARLSIGASANGTGPGKTLAADVCNVERDGERVRLCNSAFKLLTKPDQAAYQSAALKHDLDTFVEGLWAVWSRRHVADYLAGDTEDTELIYHLTPHVLRHGGTILHGAGGGAKSYITLLMAVSIDAANSSLWPVAHGVVLYVNLERSDVLVRRRLGRVNLALGEPRDRKLLMLNARGQSLAGVADAIRRAVAEHDVDVLFLDSISRAGLGKLTEDVTMNTGADLLNDLCDTWLAIAHKSKAAINTPSLVGDHAYGNIMLENAADVVVSDNTQLTADSLGVQLRVTKANDGTAGYSETWALRFDQFGLAECRKATPFEFSDLVTRSGRPSMQQSIDDYILSLSSGRASASEIAKATGFNRANVSKFLSAQTNKYASMRLGHEIQYGVRINL